MIFSLKGDYLDVVRQYYHNFIYPVVPFVCVILYLTCSKSLCDFIRYLFGQKEGQNGPYWSKFLKYFTFFHSFILALYSGWTFYNSYNLVQTVTTIHRQANPQLSWLNAFYLTNCDTDSLLWSKHDFGTWVYHFYLSKYYEFIDTWIILLKDRKPMFLQTFHHAGIVLLMWSFVASQNNVMGICITVLNSFIHTLMYVYYALASINIRLPFKSIITSAQLLQFFTGILYSTPTYWMDDCHTNATWWTQLYVNLYTLVLIGLFMIFAYNEYVLKPKAKTSSSSSREDRNSKKQK